MSTPITPKVMDKKSYKTALKLLDPKRYLTHREKKFVLNIRRLLELGTVLTLKQIERLEEVHEAATFERTFKDRADHVW